MLFGKALFDYFILFQYKNKNGTLSFTDMQYFTHTSQKSIVK